MIEWDEAWLTSSPGYSTGHAGVVIHHESATAMRKRLKAEASHRVPLGFRMRNSAPSENEPKAQRKR